MAEYPSAGYQPLSPVDVEIKLRQVVSELTNAHALLVAARTDELAVRKAHRLAVTRALLSSDCPKVERGGTTAAERDAWVDSRVEVERYALDVAEVGTANATDYLRVIRDQANVVQSIGALVREAYAKAGAS